MVRTKFCMAVLMATTVACGSSTSDPAQNATPNNIDGKGDQTGDVTMCAAVRGNGQLIPAHFGSLARIVEHYGPIHAMSGGSSASITTFLTSSIHANPLTTDCSGERCADAERNQRIALLLKSFDGYIEYLATTDEAAAISAAIPIVKRVQEAGLESLLAEDPEAASAALQGILNSEDLVALVNPEMIALLQNSPNPQYHATDILGAIKGFGAFSADDPKIVVRPGVLNFEAVADQLDVLASFYAGYGPFDTEGMTAWFADCATAGQGKTWAQVRGLPAGESSCGAEFHRMFGEYRATMRTDGALRTRGEDMVGTFMPSLISTSVLTGGAITAWQSAKAQYDSGQDPTLDINFDDVRFGYFGDQDSLDAFKEATSQRADLKSKKGLDLGTVTWRTALSLSPAEPGLARALPIDDAAMSSGGWSDLHPVLVLKDLGCDKVIYVTRSDAESPFARGVAGLLGMTAEQDGQLYDLDNPDSSFSRSLAEADAVWCTNWNNVESSELTTDGYNAPLQTSDEFFLEGTSAYSNTTADTNLVGCTKP